MSYTLLNFLVILLTNVAIIIYEIISGRAEKRYKEAQLKKYSNLPGGMGGYYGIRKAKYRGGRSGSGSRSSYNDDGGGSYGSSSSDDSRNVIWDTANGKCTDQYGYSYDTWGNPLDSDNPRGHL